MKFEVVMTRGEILTNNWTAEQIIGSMKEKLRGQILEADENPVHYDLTMFDEDDRLRLVAELNPRRVAECATVQNS